MDITIVRPTLGVEGTRPPLTTVLADDHAVVLEGLRSMLSSAEEITVVGEASNGSEAVAQARRHRPKVLLLGPSIPQPVANAVTSEVSKAVPEVAVLLLCTREDRQAVSAALRAGARGYLCKATGRHDIVRSVREVAEGWAVFSPGIASGLARIMAEVPRPFADLTAREHEILELVAAGLSNLSIARRLGRSPKTVSNHLSKIFHKLHVADRGTLITVAQDAGLGAGR
jgi:DNA-binding NarL/FixJ family response regulator